MKSLKKPTEPICQSCAAVLDEDSKGSESNGTKSQDFCAGCYDNGEFTQPEITMEQMIDSVAAYMAKNSEPTGISYPKQEII